MPSEETEQFMLLSSRAGSRPPSRYSQRPVATANTQVYGSDPELCYTSDARNNRNKLRLLSEGNVLVVYCHAPLFRNHSSKCFEWL